MTAFSWRLPRVLVLGLIAAAAPAFAQGTAFTYQGKLTSSGVPAVGSFDLEFTLYDTGDVGTGNQVGSPVTKTGVAVSGGLFTVELDFGGAPLSGAALFLEIGVKPAGGGAYTTLAPRQPIASAPYAVRSAVTSDASSLGGVAADQYVQTNDSRLTDARAPTAGSSSYVQNGTSPQAASFNVTGNGSAGGTLSGNVVNTATEYDIAGQRAFALSSSLVPYGNTFVGNLAGVATTPSLSDFTGGSNVFVGSEAGETNTTGYDNTFIGRIAGPVSVVGSGNTFLGQGSGLSSNSSWNTFVGEYAGPDHQTGDYNTFVGFEAASYDVSGVANTFIGALAGSPNGALVNNATAIGANALVSENNALVLGGTAGFNGATVNTSVGMGTPAPDTNSRLHVVGTSWFQGDTTPLTTNAGTGVAVGYSASLGAGYVFAYDYTPPAAPKALALNSPGGAVILGGIVTLNHLGTAGGTSVCLNASSQLSGCSSSLRYKTNVAPYAGGLDVVERLAPVTFDWKDGGMHDVGFAAEDVQKVDPLFTFQNDKREVEGVKYDRLTAALVNAVKEQQKEIEALKTIVCADHADRPACRAAAAQGQLR